MPIVIVPVQAHERMTEGDVERLVRYVRTARLQDTKEVAEEKLMPGYGGAVNMPDESVDAGVQALWFVNMMQANGRGKRPVLHHVLSWDSADPLPTPAQVREVVGVLERRLGLEGCACMWAGHRNTKNFHIHVLSCQVDPETLHMRRIGMSVRRALEAQCEANERLGLGHYERDLYVMQPDGNVVRKPERPKDESPPLPPGARDAENRTATKSMIRIARERLLPIIQSSQTWEEMHRRLADAGSGIAPRKGGLVVLVGDKWVKGSSVADECARKALERRLGPFQAAPSPAEDVAGREAPAPAEAIAPRPAPGRPKPKPEKPEKPEPLEQGAPPSPAPSALRLVPGRPIVEPMPMDDELLAFWRRWRRDAAARRTERERWAEERAAERRAVMENVRAGIRRAGQLVRQARARGERLVRGVMTEFRFVLEEDGRRRRQAVSARQQAEAGSRPRFADSFAVWLRTQGRPDLAERWRRRQGTAMEPVSVRPPSAGSRVQGRAEASRAEDGRASVQGAGKRLQSKAQTEIQTVWRLGWRTPEAGGRLEEAKAWWLATSVQAPPEAPADGPELDLEEGPGPRP